MWRRYSPGSSPTRDGRARRGFGAAFLAVGLGFLAPAVPATAQLSDAFNPLSLDPVTREVLSNAFTRLRFLAISIEGEDETGQALNGIVRARLARQERAEAVDEVTRIYDPIWAARSLVAIARFDGQRGDVDSARQLLRQASGQFTDLPAERIRDGGEVLRLIAVHQARLADREGAIATARLIPDARFRVQALRETASASLDALDNSAAAREAAAALLKEAFDQARQIGGTGHETTRLMIDIGRAQTRAGAGAAARATFDAARALIADGPDAGRFDAYAMLAAAMIEGDDAAEAMEVVRLIPEGGARARAIGSVARARGQTGDLDSAVPLFRLALEEAERIENDAEQYDAVEHLMVEMSKVGRLADAFTAAGQIDDQLRQSRAMLAMGQVLLDLGKYDEALVLTDYIPYIGLRAQIFGPVAMNRGMQGDPQRASELLAQALESTGYKPIIDFLAEALRRVLQAQTRAGEPDADAAIFARARDLIDLIPGDIQKVRALVQIAIAEAQRGRIANAQKTISAAYRTAWENKDQPGFEAALEDIALAQIAAGDLLSAFDTAARIPPPGPNTGPIRTADGSFITPRYRSLTRVAAASARLGETDLAIRAAQQMETASARAAGLAAVAVAMAAPASDLLEIVGDAGRTDLGVSPDPPETPPSPLGEAPPLREPDAPASAPAAPQADGGDGPQRLMPTQ